MNICTRFFAAATAMALLVPGSVEAVNLSLRHQYGEFVDRGVMSATLNSSDGSRIDCSVAVGVERIGNRLTLSARKVPGTTTYEPCTYQVTANLGSFAAGSYEITARLIAVDGQSAESETQEVQVLPLEGRCNANPLAMTSIVALHKTLTPPELPASGVVAGSLAPMITSVGLRIARMDSRWSISRMGQSRERPTRVANQRLADISRQLAAQSEHARTQDSMPSSSRQLFAHASQTSAHTPHTRAWKREPLVIKSAAV